MNAMPPFGQFPQRDVMSPRFREAGEVTLDLFHRDGRVDGHWLAFTHREFALLWQLAERPGQPITREQWLAAGWRIDVEPETSSLAIHVARVRAKLEPFGLASLIAAYPDGGYFLDAPLASGLLRAEA